MAEKIINPDYETDLRMAADCLRKGGVILYPTDTVWGIGCDATNAEAVAKVYRLKKREESKAMLVLTDDASQLELYSDSVPPIAVDMVEASDRPVTLVLDGARGLAPNLISADGSIGIRVTGERFSRDLCRRLGRPIVSTSANISGRPSPAIFTEIEPEVRDQADYTVYYRRGDTDRCRPSIVMKMKWNGEFKILRD